MSDEAYDRLAKNSSKSEMDALSKAEAVMRSIQVTGRPTRGPMKDLVILVMVGIHWSEIRGQLSSVIQHNWSDCGHDNGLLVDLADSMCECIYIFYVTIIEMQLSMSV